MEEQSSSQTNDQLQTNQAASTNQVQLSLSNQLPNVTPNQPPISLPNQPPPTSLPNQPLTSFPNQPPTLLSNQPPNLPPNHTPISQSNKLPTSFRNQPPSLLPNQPPTSLPNQPPTLLSNEPSTLLPNQPPTSLLNQPSTSLSNQPPTSLPNQLPTLLPNQPQTSLPKPLPTSLPNQPQTRQPPTSLPNQPQTRQPPTSLLNQPPNPQSNHPPNPQPNQPPNLQSIQPPILLPNQAPPQATVYSPSSYETAENKKNYDKLQELYRRSVPKLREHFHRLMPEDPKDLYIELKKYEPTLQQNKKITTKQWLLLFPPNKETYSVKFDASLFRQLFATIAPSKKEKMFWYKDPPANDQSDKVNVNRLISERNNVQHGTGYVTNDKYKEIAKRMIDAMVALGEDRNSFQNLLPPIQYGLLKPVGNFFGRGKDLQKIHDLVENGKNDITRIVVYGMPGLGKSEMVRKYCDQFGEFFNYNILWINSTTQSTLESSFLDIAEHLGLAIKDVNGNLTGIISIVNSVYNHIRSEQILFIFDDVSYIQTVKTFLPTHKPSTTIITTQLRNWPAKDFHMHELKTFHEHEGETFLLDNLEDKLINKTQLAEVLKQLGGHPLALQQFIVAIKNTTLGVNKYLHLLRTQTAKLLEKNLDNKSVISAIKISTEKLAETKASNLSLEILNTISWLYGDEIPFELLQSIFHDCDEIDIDTAIQNLISFSLVNRRNFDSKIIITVHSLVQKTMLFFQPKDDKKCFGKCIKVFEDQLEVEEEISMKVDFGLLWYKHLIHFISISLNEIEIHDLLLNKFHQIRRTLQYKGRINDLIEFFNSLLNIFNSKLGPLHEKTIDAMFYQAFCYRENRQDAQAIDLFQKVLNAQRNSYGKTNEETLATMNNLALCFQHVGILGEAIKMNEEIIDELINLHGKRHPATLTTMNNLAMCFQEEGRVGEAIKMNEEIIAELVKLHGKRHPDTLRTMNNLAWCFEYEGRLEEAIKMNEEILAELIKLHGKRHPNTLLTMNSLARCFQDKGRLGEAIKINEEILAEKIKLHGKRHPNTLLTMNNLAWCFQNKGRLAEAIKMYEEILTERIKLHGKRHPETLATMNNLALCFKDEGRLAEAIKMCEEVLDELIKLHGKRHPSSLSTMNNLAMCFQEEGRVGEAIKMNEEIIAEKIKLHGKRHPKTLRTMNNLASCFKDEGRLGDAKKVLDEAFSLSKSLLGENHPLTITILRNLQYLELSKNNH